MSQYYRARIVSIEARIVQYEDAIAALEENVALDSVTIDSGQGATTYKRTSLASYEDVLEKLLARRQKLLDYCSGANVQQILVGRRGRYR